MRFKGHTELATAGNDAITVSFRASDSAPSSVCLGIMRNMCKRRSVMLQDDAREP
jgi:hypothetical protein